MVSNLIGRSDKSYPGITINRGVGPIHVGGNRGVTSEIRARAPDVTADADAMRCDVMRSDPIRSDPTRYDTTRYDTTRNHW